MAGSGDLLVKLLLNSSGFDNGIKKSKKQVSEFEKAGQEMGKKLVTSFGQIAGAMMAIKGAGDAFKAVINSSQTIGDAFASTMSTAKTVTDNFIYSLVNADFSTFNNGLDDMISKAREAYAAMDQLGNTKMAAAFVTTSNEAEFKRYMARARDKSLSIEERQAWLEKSNEPFANIVEAQKTLKRDTMDAVKAEIAKKTGLDASNISEEIIRQTFSINAQETNKAENERILSEYAEFKRQQNKIIAPLKALEMQATSFTMGVKAQLEAAAQLPAAQERASVALQQLTKENERLIIEYTLLGRESDEALQELINLVASADAAENKISEMTTSRNEVENALNNEANAVHVAAEKLRIANEELEAERQRVYGGAIFSTGIAPGTSPFGAPNSTGDLPKSIAMLDESTLPAISFGSNEQTSQFVSNMESMQDAAGKLHTVLSGVGNVLRNDTTEAKSFGEVALSLAGAILPTIMSVVAGPVGGALTSSLLGALPSIMPFADGGIVTSATLGVFGEAGPEAVMPLDRLNDFVRDREVRVTGKITGSGKDLNVIIDNYNKVRAVK